MAEVSGEQQARITATLDGVSLGVFEDRGDLETTAPDTKYRFGSMGREKPIGGKPTIGELNATRIMDTLALGQRKWIRGRVGKGQLVITEQPLTLDEVADGEPDVWTGLLVGYTQKGRVANGDEAMTYTITCAVETQG